MSGESPYPASPPEISVSVVTYNSAPYLQRFLDSLRQQTHRKWEVLFFDNASRDDTPGLLREAEIGELYVNAANIGYARGQNHNLRRCRGDFVLLMNPDVEFGPDLFSVLLDHLIDHPEHALVGPLILEGPAKQPFPPRRFYPGEGMIALEPGWRRSDIAWLNGCCMMIRRDVMDSLGGFDADYFLYQEETDLCLRARRAGFLIGHTQKAVIHHLKFRSQGSLSDYEYARQIFKGSTIFWEKHYAPRDVVGMVRFQYWLSGLFLLLGPLRPGLSVRPAALSESRLKARRDVCAAWLKSRGAVPTLCTGLPMKIAWRQCHLAMRWLVQGRFPLDDY